MAPDGVNPDLPAIGQSLARKEDPKLLSGQGRYTDDMNVVGQAYGYVLRSTYAHGEIERFDDEAARAMPGVLAVYTFDDLDRAGYQTIKNVTGFPNRDGSAMIKPPRPSLANGRVRFVGDPVAFVVAETAVQARDAAEMIELDINPLPAVTDVDEAAKPGAPQIWPEAPGNVSLDFHYGDEAEVQAVFDGAAHVTKLRLMNDRVVVASMEPRAAIAEYDAESGRYTLRLGCQGVFGIKNGIAGLLNVDPDKVRIITGNVGGSFGMKSQPYPEYIPLLHAAKQLGRPVRWRDERSESFLSDNHGRGSRFTGELALDADGKFLALRYTGLCDIGAYLSGMGPGPQTNNIVRNSVSLYSVPLLEVSVKAIFTNATQTGPYRGAGRPEANYFTERLIDQAARETGIDRIELRRRNLIQPEAMPYKAASGLTYDSGDFPAVLARAVEKSDWNGFEERKAESAAKGLLRGRGFCSYLEVTGPPSKEMGGIRFQEGGGVQIVTGTLDYGQGHATPFTQVLCDKLGVPFDAVSLLQGDSDELIVGGGTGGSKSAIASGGAIVEASAAVIEKGRIAAAHVLETAVEDIEFNRGAFEVAGTDRVIGILELEEQLRNSPTLPDGVPDTLSVELEHDTAPSSYPNGAHVVEVEIDPDTGVTRIDRYSAVDDFGVVLNPMLVEGQVHGGIVQGLGQIFMERVVFDEDGQPQTGSFMDYAMPRADDVPDFDIEFLEVPAKTNALGVKGCGEAGSSGALGAVMNAVVDALADRGITHIDMPVTPQNIWRALNG